MKTKQLLIVLVLALLVGGNISSAFASSGNAQYSPIQLVRSSENDLILEMKASDIHAEAFVQNGLTYDRLVVPGMAQSAEPGEPQLPTRGILLGVPALEGIRVDILEAQVKDLSGYRLAPAPEIEFQGLGLDDSQGNFQTSYPRANTFLQDAFYPAEPVKIGLQSHLRDQAVAQVQFYPVQYNPARGEIRFYQRLLVRVSWQARGKGARSERIASPAYEKLLQNTLFNYASLERESTYNLKPVAGPPSATSAAVEPALKIGVQEDGLYQLTYNDLAVAWPDPSLLDPNKLQLANQGNPVPIVVQVGEDGAFDPGDLILFYGTAITDIYTTENVYWLTAGIEDGLRMLPRSGAPGDATIPTQFPATLHAEKDTTYWQTMPVGIGQDHWFWDERISPNTEGFPNYRDFTFNLDNLSTAAATATVRVRLKGYTNDTFFQGDHNTRLYLNGTLIDDQVWDGFDVFDHEVTIAHSLLLNGANTLRVEAVDTGAAVDQLFMNWLEVDYWDTYKAEGDELAFGSPAAGTYRFEVKNYTTDSIQVFDVTNPAVPVFITNPSIAPDGGSYKVIFQDTAQANSRYLALTNGVYKTPSRIELDQPSAWKSAANGADYIIITHEDLYTSTLPLADYRSAQGLRVATVKVQDIYDEFNGGVFNPQAIRDFLQYAYENWQAPAPAYVLLVGEASYDYRGTLEPPLPRVNYVPTQIIETFMLGQTASDNWFVAFGEDELLPQMFISRLPASNIAELDIMVDKVLYYDQNPPDPTWNKNLLLVADDDESSFEALSDDLVAATPFYYNISKVNAADYPPGDPTADITQKINSGSLLVNYTGHGNPETWGIWSGGRIFDDTDVAALNNAGKYPVVTVANCLNGFFVGRTNPSMAEQFLQLADKGAVAVWAPTGLGDTLGHRSLLNHFYDAIFQDDLYMLGPATTAAKINLYTETGSWAEMVETFVLFGDPATYLNIPTNYPYLKGTLPVNGGGPVPRNYPVMVTFSKPMDPATISLSGGGVTFTTAWNADYTIATFTHSPFTGGQTYTLTISGKDKLGNALGVGLAPTTWSFTAARAESYLPLFTH